MAHRETNSQITRNEKNPAFEESLPMATLFNLRAEFEECWQE